MKIYSPSAGEGNTIAVRWTLEGEYAQGHAPASEGVNVPPGAELLDIVVTGNNAQTIHVVFEPAHSDYFEEAA